MMTTILEFGGGWNLTLLPKVMGISGGGKMTDCRRFLLSGPVVSLTAGLLWPQPIVA